MVVVGVDKRSAACGRIAIGGLKPSTSYDLTVTPKNAAGEGPEVKRSGKTDAVLGRSVCKNNTGSSDPGQRTWCNDSQNGMEIFSGTTQNSTRLGRGSDGQQFEAICKDNGQRINDYVYNPGKMGTSEDDGTTVWIRLKYGDGTGYMSFAWFNLNGLDPDSTGPLPNC